MIRRTLDATRLNAIANDPAVRGQVGGAGEIDLTPVLENFDNIALVAEGGGFVFEKHGAGRYEVHTLFMPGHRGLNVLRAAREAARYLFTRTDCDELVTKLPASNRAADFMVRRCGFRPTFRRPGAWPDGSDLLFFAMSFDDWLAADPDVEREGQAFHGLLEAAKAAAGSDLPTHADDPAHDRAAGAASLMSKAGQIRKAVWSYNRWARLAGYETIVILSDAPPVVDVRDAIITVTDGELEVLQCRQGH